MQEFDKSQEQEQDTKKLLLYYWPGTQEEFEQDWPNIYKEVQERRARYISQENEKRASRQARSTGGYISQLAPAH